MDIKLIRFTSGEEILAEVISTGTTSTVINDAVSLVYQEIAPGQMSVGFAPFMPYSDGVSITLYHSAIAAITTPKDQILGEYTRVFSKIVIAPANSI